MYIVPAQSYCNKPWYYKALAFGEACRSQLHSQCLHASFIKQKLACFLLLILVGVCCKIKKDITTVVLLAQLVLFAK